MAQSCTKLALGAEVCLIFLTGCNHSLEGRHRPAAPAATPVASRQRPTSSPYATIPQSVVQPESAKTELAPVTAKPPPLVQPVSGTESVPKRSLPPPQPVLDGTAPSLLKPPPAQEDMLLEVLRCYLNKRPEQALELLKRYDPQTQEVLLRTLPLLTRLAAGNLASARPETIDLLLDQLAGVEAALQANAPLVIAKMCFCKQIASFGAYEPWPLDHAFQSGGAGQPGERVQVYVELRHVASRLNGEHIETCLSSRLEIRDQNNRVAYQSQGTAELQRHRSAKRDFFIKCGFDLPGDLPPGPYTLRIQVEDHIAKPHHLAERALDFRIVPHGLSRAVGN